MAATLPHPNPANIAQWAQDFLAYLGDPQTPSNETFLESWVAKESGAGYNGLNGSIAYNPLNTTQPEPGSVGAGSQGNIASYPNWAEGIAGNATALDNGYYPAITAALKAGDAAQANASGALNPNLDTWGTGTVPTTIPAGGGTFVTSGAGTGSSATGTSSAQTTGIVGDIVGAAGGVVGSVIAGGSSVAQIVPRVESFLLSLVFVVAALGLIVLGLTRLFPGATRVAALAAA